MSNVISISKYKTSLFVKDLRDKAKGTIFSIGFWKKDGTYREMVCRFGVNKNLTGKGMSYDPLDRGMFCVYDMQKQGYRMVRVDAIDTIKIKKRVYNFT